MLTTPFKRVAIVDDIEEFQFLARMMFGYIGCQEVTTYASGVDALPRLLESPPDLLVLDIMMADLDGLTILDRLRKHPATVKLPIILCTAAVNHFIDQEDQIRHDPLVQILAKPFSIEELEAAMTSMMARLA